MSKLSLELVDTLRLFIPSPNSVSNLGVERDKWVPNPKRTSKRDFLNFYRLGFIMGICNQNREIMNLNIPSIFWKYLLGFDLEWKDIKSVHHNIYVCLEKIESMETDQLEYLDEVFVAFLFDGTEVELKPNGKNIVLT